MKNQRTRTGAVTGLLLAFAVLRLGAQNVLPSYVGGCVGAEIGSADGSVPVYDRSPSCGEFGSGRGEAFSVGAIAIVPDLFGSGFGIGARLAWTRATESFAALPLDPQAVFDRQRGEPVYLEREYRLNLTRELLRFDLSASYRIGSLLLLSFGPSLGIATGIGYTQTDHLLGPGDIRFADGSTEQAFVGGSNFTSAGIVPGVAAGIAWQLALGGDYLLVPELSARAELTSPVNEAVWHRYTIGAGVALLYDLSPNDPPVPPPAPILTASVDLYAVGPGSDRSDSTSITVLRTLHRRYTPLLPVIFFDSASASPASRYRMLSRSEAASFAIDSSVRRDPAALNHHLLDIVAQRMLSDTSASVALLGRRSADETAGLVRQRSDMIRRYLHETWGIAVRRITDGEDRSGLPLANEATPEGRAENRRVELLSDTPALLAPMAREEVSYEFDPPTIGMTPSVRAEAGVRRWEIIVRYGEREVQRYSSDDGGGSRDDIAWNLVAEQVSRSATPLNAELIVEDSSGRRATARDEIMLSLMTSQTTMEGQAAGDREIRQRRIIGFGYGSAEPGERARREIEEMSRIIHPGATITVTGYADRLGEVRVNHELSRLRAMMVGTIIEDALKRRSVNGVTVQTAAGESGDDMRGIVLPEERMVTRCVVMTVEQKEGHGDSTP